LKPNGLQSHAVKRARAWPLGTVLVLLLLVVCFELIDATRERTGLGPELLPERWVLDGTGPRVWQYLTYAFVHENEWHLRLNALSLAIGCGLAERRVGSLALVASFLAACVAVGRGFHALDDRDLYGASGAAAAMFALSAVVWLAARARPWWARLAPLAVALAYVLWTEVLPARAGHPNPGRLPHTVGYVVGAVGGALFAARERMKRSSRAAKDRTGHGTRIP
jgi:membrane associated rhomboid family serine protease